MSRPNTPVPEDRFASFLEEFDDALRSGKPTDDLKRQAAGQFDPKDLEILETLENLRLMGAFEPKESLPKTRTADFSSVETRVFDDDDRKGLRNFGRFEIRRRIGAGGSGVVFLAFDGTLNREVALKVPRVDAWMVSGSENQFLKEARAAARFDHPNIVPIYETGHVGAVAYIVSAYCRGPSLSNWLRQRDTKNEPVPIEPAARWIEQLARAIDYAHKRNIVHRDLKPGNILLEPPPEHRGDVRIDSEDILSFVPRITDFGIAKLLESEEGLTATAAILGTPQYMAPEQADSTLGEVGPAADIYALGVILYQLLTDSPPIKGETEIDILRRIGIDEPEPIRRIRPDVPRDLEAVCLKCLEKNPEQRYPAAAELADDLQRYLSGEPVLAKSVGGLRRTWKRIGRQRVSAKIVAGCLLFVLGMMAVVLWRTPRTAPNIPVASPVVATRDLPPDATPEQIKQLELVYFQDIMLAFRVWEDNATKLRNSTTASEEMQRLLNPYRPRAGRRDVRGFEWHYLWRLAHPQLFNKPFEKIRSLTGHSGKIFHVTYSPDGRLIATAGADGTARLWDAASGALIHVLSGHIDDVNVVAFSPDGLLVATASDDHTIKLFDTKTGKERTTLVGHQHWVCDVAFSHDGKQLVSGDQSGLLKVWDVKTATVSLTRKAHNDRIMALAISPNGRWMATASDDGTVKVWDTVAFQLLQDYGFYSPGSKASSICFSHNSKYLAVGGADRSANDPEMIVLYDVERGQPLMTLGGHRQRVHALEFSPDDRALVSTSEDRTVLMWDLATRTSFRVVEELHRPGWSLAFSPDGSRLATADEGAIVRIWDSSNTSHQVLLPGHEASVDAFALSPDGRFLATGTWAGSDGHDGILRLWNLETDTPKLVYEESGGAVRSVAFSPDGQELAVGMLDGADGKPFVRFLDSSTHKERMRVGDFDGQIRQVSYALDGRLFVCVTGADDSPIWTIDFRDTASGTKLDTIPTPHDHGTPMPVLSDGKLMAAATKGNLVLYDLSTRKLVRTIEGTGFPIFCLRFSPDGRLLVGGGTQGKIILWNSRTGSHIVTHTVGFDDVDSLAFSPGGRTIAAGSKGQVMLVDLADGKQLLSLPLPYDVQMISHLVFSRDGSTIAAASGSDRDRSRVILWRAGPQSAPRPR